MPLAHSFPSLLVATAFLLFFTTSVCYGVSSFSDCDRSFTCGAISNVTFPFSGGDRPDHCGLPEFKFTCDPTTNVTELTHNSVTYRVLQLDQSLKRLTLSRLDLYNNTCLSHFVNTTLNSTLFSYGDEDNEALTIIYGCNSTVMTFTPHNLFTCAIPTSNFTDTYYILGPIPSDPILRFIKCTVSVTVPLLRSAGVSLSHNRINLAEALMEGFVVNYTDRYETLCSRCAGFGGQCGYDSDVGEPVCMCGDRPCTLLASPPQSSANASESFRGNEFRNLKPLQKSSDFSG